MPSQKSCFYKRGTLQFFSIFDQLACQQIDENLTRARVIQASKLSKMDISTNENHLQRQRGRWSERLYDHQHYRLCSHQYDPKASKRAAASIK